MQTKRAHAAIEVKAVDEDKREIFGVATTPTPDRMGDIVDPKGVQFKNPLPLLHQHDHRRPVGHAFFERATDEGIRFTAKLPKITNEGELKQRVDLAWDEIKAGLVRGVSIGFKAKETSFMEDGGIHFLESEVIELSLVTIPANAEATIEAIKSFDVVASDQDIEDSGVPEEVQKKTGDSVHVVKLADDKLRKPYVIRNIIRKE